MYSERLCKDDSETQSNLQSKREGGGDLDNTLRQPTPPTTVTSAQFPRGRGRNHHLLSARGLCYEENPVREPRASYCIKISETGKKKQVEVGGGGGGGGAKPKNQN